MPPGLPNAMKITTRFCFAITVLVFTDSSARAENASPISTVVDLLQGMIEKGTKALQDEQVEFNSFKQFCDDTNVDTGRAIDESASKISTLQAEIEDHQAAIDRLTREIAEHDGDLDAWAGDKSAATEVDKIETQDYQALHKDYSESIDALKRAIQVLGKNKGETGKHPQESSLLELASVPMVPDDVKSTIEAFVQSNVFAIPNAPDANAYEFQSHGVVEMLNKLLDKFTDEKNNIEQANSAREQAFDTLINNLDASTNDAQEKKESKTGTRLKHGEDKTEAEQSVRDETATKKAAEEYLVTLKTTCKQKTTDFNNRQQLRAEEIEALKKAKEVVEDAAVPDQKHIHTAASFAQLRSVARDESKQVAARYLASQASALHSNVLAALATRVTSDPFAKVTKMIEDLLVRLREEAANEATEKTYCDKQLQQNEQLRKKKTAKVESLHADHDELTAHIAQLGNEISDLNSNIANLDTELAERTTQRTSEKKLNEEAISDAKAGQAAIAKAIEILKEFYAKAGEATSFVQSKAAPHTEIPEIFDTEYKGMQSENGGVIGILEVSQSDFARLEADTKSSEAASAREYDEFKKEAKANRHQMSTDIEHKTAKKQDKSQALILTDEDLEGTQTALGEGLEFFAALKERCIDPKPFTYEERVAKREEEIESLQKALEILAAP